MHVTWRLRSGLPLPLGLLAVLWVCLGVLFKGQEAEGLRFSSAAHIWQEFGPRALPLQKRFSVLILELLNEPNILDFQSQQLEPEAGEPLEPRS